VFSFVFDATLPGMCDTYSCRHPTNRQPHQVIVSQHSPLLTTAPAQLNDNNLDFSQRRPYHQSQLRPNEELPLCCDDN